jgi:hypothetical protein
MIGILNMMVNGTDFDLNNAKSTFLEKQQTFLNNKMNNQKNAAIDSIINYLRNISSYDKNLTSDQLYSEYPNNIYGETIKKEKNIEIKNLTTVIENSDSKKAPNKLNELIKIHQVAQPKNRNPQNLVKNVTIKNASNFNQTHQSIEKIITNKLKIKNTIKLKDVQKNLTNKIQEIKASCTN